MEAGLVYRRSLDGPVVPECAGALPSRKCLRPISGRNRSQTIFRMASIGTAKTVAGGW
jgi:hypothetical protein